MVQIANTFRLILGSLLAATLVSAVPTADTGSLLERQSNGRLVFAHFMIGIVGDRASPADYDNDMRRAKALGIDAFALNIGTETNTDQQLNYAYQSAANNGMKVFISFDFAFWSTGNGAAVGAKIGQYAGLPAQLFYQGKAFASSFVGDGVDVGALRNAAGREVFWVPNFHPGQSSFGALDGAFNWQAWASNGNNKAPTPGHTVSVADGDAAYRSALGGKPYLAPVSPWFNTHYGPEVPYSKNWVFPSDLLWYNRWNEILTLSPQFLEIISWNDYGESHYIGPLSSLHWDDGNSKWVNDMPHNGWGDMAKPFIAAYKAGSQSVNNFITSDQLVYWYRPTLKSLNCDSTDTTMLPANNDSGNYFQGRPNGWDSMSDSVFVVSLLTSPGVVTVVSGGNTRTFNAPAGASAFQVDMQVGQQAFYLTRGSTTVLSAVSLKNVSPTCICGLYNFNAYVGTVPAGSPDPLGRDGIGSLTIGLRVSTCAATPTLSTAPPAATNPPPTTTAPPTTTPPPNPGQVCIAGRGDGNYGGLCSFCCNFGYCPPGPCVCTATGSQVPPPPNTGTVGVPLPGEDASYLGLCSYACDHGYCPNTACMVR
ncbi:hypothetical protein HYFRA_00011737 [Hymenoscyphus fraxineus]|uniref:Glycoside hydrolase family 71 protein n=1 Tax=Hymenoscyphus fraxineus TaxID=746836 RepID=A0A9N9L772_9HELO|nr:hypothetical protein HYFRA_00011737 [Hymenoscyphus fraxineus]